MRHPPFFCSEGLCYSTEKACRQNPASYDRHHEHDISAYGRILSASRAVLKTRRWNYTISEELKQFLFCDIFITEKTA
jgi:hypothetical protein